MRKPGPRRSVFDKIGRFRFAGPVPPGERADMPVTFHVDPGGVEDRDAKHTRPITLSYSFYEIKPPEHQAALARDGETGKNTK